MLKRMAEIAARKAEIRSLLEGEEQIDLAAFESELDSLENEEKELNKRQALLDGLNDGTIPANDIDNPAAQEIRKDTDMENKEYRSAFLKNLMGQPLSEEEQRAFAAGGVAGALPTETVNSIFGKLAQICPMLDEINLFHFPGAVNFAVEGTRNLAAVHTENADINDSADTLVQVTLGAYEFVKIIKVSETVKQMTVNGFETWLVDQLAASVAEKIDYYIVNGTGSSQPKGIEAAATWTDGTNAVEWAGASLAAADLHEAIGLLPGRYDRGAKFYMSKKTLWTNVAALRDDSKAPILHDDGKGGYYIYGYPVALDDNFTDGTIFLGNAKTIYGNLGENINVASDAHAGFTSASVVYRGLAIFDCKPAVADAFVKIAASLS